MGTGRFRNLVSLCEAVPSACAAADALRPPREIVELDALLLVQENDVASSQMQSTLAPHTTVLLLPSPDDDTSIETLRERQRIRYNGIDLNEYCVRHPSNHLLAKLVVYTKGKTPEETCDEVMARVDPARGPIILIGPMQTGKSTVAQRLSERLGLPRESLDDHRWRYYEEIGFTRAEMQRIDAAEGAQGVIDYWKRFDAHAVDRLLTEFTRGVFDFGAGHSVYDDPDALERVRVRLEPFPNVVLLLPSPDADESVRILEQRSTPTIGGVELNRYLVTSPASRALAKLVVYTEGKTPEDTRDEILGHIAVPA